MYSVVDGGMNRGLTQSSPRVQAMKGRTKVRASTWVGPAAFVSVYVVRVR
jgi:hypothetical protein